MTDRTFLPYFGAFGDPKNWTPTGVPQSGDMALIRMDSVLAQGMLPSGVLIDVVTYPNIGLVGTLTLKDATVPAGTEIDEYPQTRMYIYTYDSSLQFEGAVINDGTLLFFGGRQPVIYQGGATLANNGTIFFSGSSPEFRSGAATVPIVNDGAIRVINPYNDQQVGLLEQVTGVAGTITVSTHAGLELGQAVASGQTLEFVGGVNAGASVQIDQPSGFAATIGGFVTGNTLTLANTAFTSTNFVATGAGSGVLQIYDGGSAPVASLPFVGLYTARDFSVSASGSSVTITTDVTNTATGSTAIPTSSGVYRFFDTSNGTHFYTASLVERDNVLLKRPDLVEEGNGFGASLAASSTTESVYRFFDTVHGTHFFTASAAERDQVIATRTDLTYEPSATFLEDATSQAGDVAVYRLFSKVDGTHFYTASAAELSALTTPGGAGYRPDFVSEGVSFYAAVGRYL